MAEKISVYGTAWCPHCHAVKEFFKEKGIKFEDIDIEKEQEKAKEMIEKSGQMGVPVIVINDEIIVGFDKEKIERLLE